MIHSSIPDPAAVKRSRNRLRALGMTDHLSLVIVAVVIGSLSGIGAILLRLAIGGFQVLFFSRAHPEMEFLQAMPWFMKMLIPATGGLVVGFIIQYIASEVKGHGVPEVMEALARKGGIIRARIVAAKIVGSAICIGSGGSTGREGPIVQTGAAIGSTIGQILKISGSRMRTLVGCGAAAGIAAAFNAPIAGALFALEVVLGDFAVAQFSPIVISSVTATIISRYYFGNMPAFEIPSYDLVSAFEMIPYALLGILAGLAGILFIRLLYGVENLFDHSRIPPVLKPAIGGLLLGVVALWFPHIYGVGYETMDHALEGYFGGWLLLAIFFAKIVATSLTLGSGGSGGIFAPSLFMGSMLGGFLGTFVHHLFPHLTAGHGAYALVGMGAMVAATIHAPITSIIIIFELTNDYSIILPLMASCILATLISTRLHPLSIYTMKLARRGIDLQEGKDINIFRNLKVGETMDEAPVTVNRGEPFETIARHFLAGGIRSLFVIDREDRLVGIIPFDHLRQSLPEWQDLEAILVADDVMVEPSAMLTKEDTLDRAVRFFARTAEEELPVVGEDGVLVGVVSRNRAISAYHRELLKEDLALDMREGLTEAIQSSQYRLSGHFVLASFPVPRPFIGKSLIQLQIRSRFNVEVVLIKDAEGNEILPEASHRFHSGETICVVGEKSLVEDVKRL